ncbi:Erich6b [Phodopus roborovskii]|uniref:Erich6b protein n=1 Tax=Phodopus roborovskii TaxID=109678 RepID=A0AAU9ZQN9_PHORO|nr:Erich6b [Phodopus roborovskii]
MSKDNLSPEPSGPGPPVASKHSTLAATLDREDSEEQEDESSLEESLSSQEDESGGYDDDDDDDALLLYGESIEDDESLEEEYLEEEYLEKEDYLDEKAFLQNETYLFKKAFVEDKKYLKEREFKKHLKSGSGILNVSPMGPVHSPVQVINLMTATPPSSNHDLKFATSSYYSLAGIPITLRDQSSQTEWPYFGSKLGTPLRSKTVLDQDSSSMLTHTKSELEVESFPQGSFWDTIINGPFDKQEDESFDSISSSYQSVFREIISELASRHELEEDMDMPLSKLMEVENRKKLGLMLKKNFDKYRETILWIMKKREAGQKMSEKSTTITYTLSTLIQPMKSDEQQTLRRSSTFKKLKLDKEWIQAKMKAHRSDGKLVTYHSGKSFHILFPNGTGQIYYPSGNLALLITCKGVARITYFVLEDCAEKMIRGFVTNSGHATFYDKDGGIWLSLSKLLGYYFPKDKHQKAWNWWNLSLHVHAPPIMCITLKLNKYIHVQIRSQDKVIFCFSTPKQKRICLNMGTKFKFVNLKLLQAMKKKTILETEPGPTLWKIQALLGKISRSLNFLTLSDLENFTQVIEVALNKLSMRKSRTWL